MRSALLAAQLADRMLRNERRGRGDTKDAAAYRLAITHRTVGLTDTMLLRLTRPSKTPKSVNGDTLLAIVVAFYREECCRRERSLRGSLQEMELGGDEITATVIRAIAGLGPEEED
jgi:hypothetical protein